MKPRSLLFFTEEDMRHLEENYGVEAAPEDIPGSVWARIVGRVETRLKEDDWFWTVVREAFVQEGLA